MLLGSQAQQQVELFGEEVVVVGQVEAEEWEGFDEGAAAGHDVGRPPESRSSVAKAWKSVPDRPR